MSRLLRARHLLLAAAIAAATVAAFLPVTRNGFLIFDDPAYVTRNPKVTAGLTVPGMVWALTTTAAGNWHPLTWVSHMLDVSLFGLRPAAHHLSGVALHALTAALLFLVLRAMTGATGRSALVAALFALHPLHVESVAWASERKDQLSGLFWVLTLGAYLRHARRPGTGRYLVALLCLALGLLAKQMAVTLPFVLLLLDWWPLGRLGAQGGAAGRRTWPDLRAVLAEKVPFLLVAAAAGVVTFVVQRSAGAVKGLELIPVVPRVFNAGYAAAAYLAKTFWPFGLAPFYPHLGPELPLPRILAAFAALLAVSLAARLLWRTSPWLAAGWLWYLVTLLPVIGIVQIGWQAMADRYTYLPLIGVFVALAWELARRAGGPGRTGPLALAALLVLAGLASLTWRQLGYWRDSVTYFGRAVEVTPDNMMARYYLGAAERIAGHPDEAIRNLREAIRLNPRFPAVYTELAGVLSDRGDDAGAAGLYARAMQLGAEGAVAHFNFGNALARLGRREEALAQYEAALRADPQHAAAHTNAGVVLAELGRNEEAARHFRLAAEAQRAAKAAR